MSKERIYQTSVSVPSPAIKMYSTTPETVQAATITDQNLEDLARWCGGEVREGSNPKEGQYKYIVVPHFSGALFGRIGSILVKNQANNRFYVMTTNQFEDKQYHEIGLRQDGFTPRYPNVTITSGTRDVLDMS